VPVEIRQLVIKSKTISEESQNTPFDSDKRGSDPEQNPAEAGLAYHLMGSPDEARER